MRLNPEIWGPHFWFFLHTLTLCYPNYPNSVTKKKYYEFIQNLPLFIPVEDMAKSFEELLSLYPVSPYLDSRDAFVKWMHFIHNKVNERLEKPTVSYTDFYQSYYEQYKPTEVKWNSYYKVRGQLIYLAIIISLFSLVYYLYNMD
jgi:hypothetical protein